MVFTVQRGVAAGSYEWRLGRVGEVDRKIELGGGRCNSPLAATLWPSTMVEEKYQEEELPL